MLDQPETAPHHHLQSRRIALVQTAVVIALFVVGGGAFYAWRSSVLDAEAAVPAPTPSSVSAQPGVPASQPQSAASAGATAAFRPSPLGDMSAFIVISQDTLALLADNNQSGATARITDLESAWDNAAAALQRRDKNEWHAVDDKIDAVLRELRSTSPDPVAEKQALQALLTQMGA